jgi:hypothetical protein
MAHLCKTTLRAGTPDPAMNVLNEVTCRFLDAISGGETHLSWSAVARADDPRQEMAATTVPVIRQLALTAPTTSRYPPNRVAVSQLLGVGARYRKREGKGMEGRRDTGRAASVARAGSVGVVAVLVTTTGPTPGTTR